MYDLGASGGSASEKERTRRILFIHSLGGKREGEVNKREGEKRGGGVQREGEGEAAGMMERRINRSNRRRGYRERRNEKIC